MDALSPRIGVERTGELSFCIRKSIGSRAPSYKGDQNEVELGGFAKGTIPGVARLYISAALREPFLAQQELLQ